jgi:kynurenine 3-monooxygenase
MRYDSLDDKEPSFNQIQTGGDVQKYFETYFPDLLPLIPDLTEQYFNNPTPPLGTVRCTPWTAYGKTLMMGDASHAIVPFYGQGMNASFEDVVVFDKVLNSSADWESAMQTFSRKRKPDADAIADLALDNFIEMRDSVAHPDFQKKRQIEMKLEGELDKYDPSRPTETYSSKYSLVTFSSHIGYREAMLRGRAQDRAILLMLRNNEINVDESVPSLLNKIVKATEKALFLRA